MSADLEPQLVSYGSWLRHHYPSSFADTVRETATTDTAARMFPTGGSRSRQRAPWLGIAAAIVVLLGGLGLVIAQREQPSPVDAFSVPEDPDAQLFVLPQDPDDFVLSAGNVSTARPDDDPGARDAPGVIVGTDTNGTLTDLVAIRVSDGRPQIFDVLESVELDTATGPVVAIDDPIAARHVTQQRGDVWIHVSGASPLDELVEVLNTVTVPVTADGAIGVEDPQRTTVEDLRTIGPSVDYATYFEMAAIESGARFTVETATSPSALVFGVYFADKVQPTTINGTQAWIMTRDGQPDQASAGVVWRATPNRVIALGGDSGIDLDTLTATAEQLIHVEPDDWFARFPDVDRDN